MIMYTLFTVLLVAGQFSLGIASTAEGDDLEALCSGRFIELITTTQLQSLVEKLGGSSCPNHIGEALTDLNWLIKEDSNNVCTMDKVNKIKSYYAKHLDNSQTSARANKVPKSLRRFAVAYAMQVFSHCKLHMLNVLFEKGADALKASHFDKLKEWTRDGGAVSNLLAAIAKPGEIVWPSDLEAVLPDKTSIGRKLESNSKFHQIITAQTVCRRRFQPIYRPVVEPVAALSRAGFDLPDVLLNVHELKDVELIQECMNKWSRIVFLCESLDMIDTESREEALDYIHLLDFSPVEKENNSKPSGGVGTLLITGYDRKLNRLLDSFSTHKTESDRIKDKLMRRSWRLLRARFRHGKYGALFKSALGHMKWKGDDKKLQSINKEIIDLLEAKEETPTYKAISGAVKPIERFSKQVLSAMTVMDILGVTGITREELEDAKKVEEDKD